MVAQTPFAGRRPTLAEGGIVTGWRPDDPARTGDPWDVVASPQGMDAAELETILDATPEVASWLVIASVVLGAAAIALASVLVGGLLAIPLYTGLQPMRLKLSDPATLTAVKTLHTAVWLIVEAAFAIVIYGGMTRRRSLRTAVAAAIVAGESVIYFANGARCPLTSFAESLGAEKGSVTDIFLPRWIARNLPILHLPLVVAALWLHVRRRWATR